MAVFQVLDLGKTKEKQRQTPWDEKMRKMRLIEPFGQIAGSAKFCRASRSGNGPGFPQVG